MLAAVLIFSGNSLVNLTSTDKFCNACHNVHPHATTSWKMSTHYDNKRGIVVHCVDCHLPEKGLVKFTEKVRTGVRDVYGTLFKDVENLNWEEKSTPAFAVHHTYESSCIGCHENLFPMGLSREGEDAHFYYSNNDDDLHCINCHIAVGHYSEENIHAHNTNFANKAEEPDTVYQHAAVVEAFENFTEQIPGTGSSFKMVAVKGGSFTMGGKGKDAYAEEDEMPQREISLNDFFIGETEVSWELYLQFFKETGSQGRMSESELAEALQASGSGIDAISGPTPPWGNPGQGWGRGQRPAITMSHYAATVFCEWLSAKTGKNYRLPTEAEWEYAARGGTEGDYFFGGDAKDYSADRFLAKIFGVDTSTINSYAVYKLNSGGRTHTPESVFPNPYGIRHMLGNVAEFCSDYYSADAYSERKAVDNPAGPGSGEEHVIRGGSFNSDAADLRVTNREHTQTTAWLKTDPQMPKSKWWYSDAIHVGIRLVCEFDNNN